MTCDDLRDFVSAKPFSEMTCAERGACSTHLGSCTGCSGWLEALAKPEWDSMTPEQRGLVHAAMAALRAADEEDPEYKP